MSTKASPLLEKVLAAPSAPGCYLFYDGMGNIIYVGKSRLLTNRVRQYFQPAAAEEERTAGLVREIRDVAYVVTDTELNALMEEYRLIKRHRPWFNAQHKRDTQQPFLRIPLEDPYPSLSIAAERAADGAAYFGVFRDRWDAEKALALLGEAWHTPRCGRRFAAPGDKPCLFHQTGQCAAPCAGLIAQEAYRERIADVARLLSGKPAELPARLEKEMRDCAAGLQFERAAALKQTLEQLERLRRRCSHQFRIEKDTYAAVFARGYGERMASVFLVRQGRIVGRADVGAAIDETAAQALAQAYLDPAAALPDSDWMVPCLMDVQADKLCLPLPRRPKAQTVCQHILRGHAQFVHRWASPAQKASAPAKSGRSHTPRPPDATT